jgi:cysteinyl-tRNA synthetase
MGIFAAVQYSRPMQREIQIYNTLSRSKERFEPLNPPFVGLYVCGPTVYGDAHLGHARPAITFDLVFRYLSHLGFKVRYVRNITDVGHLENDADEGEDKIARKARLEQLEPMEVVQYFTDRYHMNMAQLNVKSPSIEPRASGHIIEQIEMVKEILKAGIGYEVNGSVYFDVETYNKAHHYGKLSGRVLDDLMTNTRSLEGQDEKRNPFDFALWKKAQPEHIMRWPSPWSDGFPGWHLECSAMSNRYLGDHFDIHGGGMDLLFPHHEAEIAQSCVVHGKDPVKYWMHNNMITIEGQKMGKSLGNFITLNEFFNGAHPRLTKAYSPMTIRFFILQAHYRSTLDFSNEALQAAEKGLERLMAARKVLEQLKPGMASTFNVGELREKCYAALDDDFNSPIAIAYLFDAVRIINSIKDGKGSVSESDLQQLREWYETFVGEILGLKEEAEEGTGDALLSGVVELLIRLRAEAKARKDFSTADEIREELGKLGIALKDTREGVEWQISGKDI